MKQDFKIEHGRLVKYTKDGRKRNHWISHFRHLSRKFLKSKCENSKCNFIISKKNYLTIHHKIALSTAKSEEELRRLCEEDNCQTLCKNCHSELERELSLKRNGKGNKKKKVKLVKKVKLEKLSSESLLVLEKGLWGEYRISSSNTSLIEYNLFCLFIFFNVFLFLYFYLFFVYVLMFLFFQKLQNYNLETARLKIVS